jgi:taurine dioxygenase
MNGTLPSMLGTVSRLDAPFGVAIEAGDLERTLDDGDAGELAALFDQHQLLVFRCRELSVDAQTRLVSLLGPVGRQPNGNSYSFVSNTRDDANPALRLGPLTFHSDYAFTATPLTALSLYAEQAAPGAVTTLFASAVRVAQQLTPAVHQQLVGRSARHVYDPHDIPGRHAPGLRRGELQPSDEFEASIHPVLVRHPRTGAEVLYINYAQTEQILGIDRAESTALLDDLFGLFYRADNVYEHHWRPGDLVLWDNVALQHGRGDVGTDVARSLRRVVIPGVPLAA